MDSLGRWDRYREAREQFADRAIALIKRKKMVEHIVALIVRQKTLATFVSNLWERHEAMVQKFNNTLLAIKFKSRYTYRFKKHWGEDWHHRHRNHCRRYFTLLSSTRRDRAEQKSHRAIYLLLSKVDLKREFFGILEAKLDMTV